MNQKQDTQWTLWGDGPEPVKEGTEEEVKQAYFESDKQDKLYVQSPDGHEWEFDGKKWIQAY